MAEQIDPQSGHGTGARHGSSRPGRRALDGPRRQERRGPGGGQRDALLLGRVDMHGVVVIGEGEKDEAPMLFIGEEIGNGQAPEVDIAVDPIDGTRLTALGLPGAIAVVARRRAALSTARRRASSTWRRSPSGRRRSGRWISPLGRETLSLARRQGCDPSDITVVILDRPRHDQMIQRDPRIGRADQADRRRRCGGRDRRRQPGTGVDMLIGIGGAPEAVIAATAIRAWRQDPVPALSAQRRRERAQAEGVGADLNAVLTHRPIWYSLTMSTLPPRGSPMAICCAGSTFSAQARPPTRSLCAA